MIEVKNLTKAFGDHVVLDNISEHIEKGEKVVVVGPSGSGKSTFLRCLNLLEIPTSGEIWFEGSQINAPKVDVNKLRQKMGMVFQHFNLFPHLTVLQNITLAPVKLKLMSKEEAEQNAMRLLERIGLADKAGAYPSMISGGQKQRIAIARAILRRTPILILDEATSAVDTETESEIQAAIDQLAGSRTILVIAHRLSTVMRADEILVLEDGRAVQRGTHEELLRQNGLYAKLCHIQQIGGDPQKS